MPPLFPHRYIRLRMAYEDLIFCSLSLVLVLLAGFCLGVERGKRISGAPVPVAEAPIAVPSPLREVNLAPVIVEQRAVPVQTLTPGGPYAIQLASYVGMDAAQVEAKRLQRLGFMPRVIRQGKYYELRVIGYHTRDEASGSLATLKKTYHDSFIKRLSS